MEHKIMVNLSLSQVQPGELQSRSQAEQSQTGQAAYTNASRAKNSSFEVHESEPVYFGDVNPPTAYNTRQEQGTKPLASTTQIGPHQSVSQTQL